MSADGLDWMPWFWRRFWGSERVARMSDSAALLYQWLLSQQFEEGHLPPADVLRRIVPARFASRWTKLWAEVEPCFEVLDGGRLENAVCAEHRLNALGLIEKRRAAAIAAGRASGASRRAAKPEAKDERPLNGRSTADAADVQRQPNKEQDRKEEQAPSVLPPTPKVSPKRIPLEPDWAAHPTLDTPSMRVAWGTWSAHRRGLKSKPWTAPGLAQCFAELAAMGPERAIAAIQHSVARNYQGIYEPKLDAVRGQRSTGNAPTPGGLQDRFGTGAPPRPRTIETTGGVQRAEAG